MNIHKIQIQDRWIYYQVIIKNIKHCYLQVEQGQLIVKASPKFTMMEIENCIYRNAHKILPRLDAYEPKASYVDRGYVYIWNEKYRIVLEDKNKKSCQIEGSTIYVYHPKIQETIEAYVKEVLYNYCYQYSKKHSDMVSIMPTIKVRKMKRRWGSCFFTKNTVCFNMALIHLSKVCVDYVIVHELCHFKHPNHSKNFYQEVEKYMPDYKRRIQLLKGESL